MSEVSHHTYGVILSGFTYTREDIKDRTFFDKGTDRLLHTIYLYREKKIDSIIVTGGISSLVNKDDEPEASRISYTLTQCGIPKERIIVEPTARNTHENAVNTAKIVKDSKCILVTSAFHMRRAMGCFEKENIPFTPFPVDYYTHDGKIHTPATLIIPSENAFRIWAKFIKEGIGYTAYSIMGYI